ncbi:MAG: hypothetical protein ACK4UO_01460 [Pseudolabrys sp.]
MEIGTFRKWLVAQGCRLDGDEHPRAHQGHGEVTVHREGRSTPIPLQGPHQRLDPRVVQRVCDALGLDASQLPGPKSRV